MVCITLSVICTLRVSNICVPDIFVAKEAPVAPWNLLRAGARFVTSEQDANSVLVFVFLRVDKWSFSGLSSMFGNFPTRMVGANPSWAQPCVVDKEWGLEIGASHCL